MNFLKKIGGSLGLAMLVGNIFAQQKPNIIVFFVDDMGLMDTSLPFMTDAKGNPQRYPLNDWYHTPNMERMANQGVRFSRFYAQSLSSPSRASLITGQNSARHRITNWIDVWENNRGQFGPSDWNWDGLSERTPVLPKVLRQNGYKTIHVGKSHLGRIGAYGDDPLNLGYEVKVGATNFGPFNYWGEKSFGYADKNRMAYLPNGLEEYCGKDIFLTEAITLEAKKEMKKACKEHRPFYLYMAQYAVHAPFCTDRRFIDHYKDSDKSPQAKAYATMIEGMDKSLGDLLSYLNELGIADNTLVFFIGDNGSDTPFGNERGYSSSAPLRGKKGTEYEGGVRVPFIACWGKTNAKNPWQQKLPIPAGSIQNQPGTIMDIYPTILSLLDIDIPTGHTIDGFDLKQQLAGNKNEQRSETILMHFPHEHWGNYFTTYIEKEWKLIYYYNPKLPCHPFCELYNLNRDPYETNNVAAVNTPKLVEMMKKMTDALEEQHAAYPVDKEGKTLRPFIYTSEK